MATSGKVRDVRLRTWWAYRHVKIRVLSVTGAVCTGTLGLGCFGVRRPQREATDGIRHMAGEGTVMHPTEYSCMVGNRFRAP